MFVSREAVILAQNALDVSLCEGLRAGAGSLSYIVHVDCCGLSTIVIKKMMIIIIRNCLAAWLRPDPLGELITLPQTP